MTASVQAGIEGTAVAIPEIESRRKQESYEELVIRLSVQSVRKHYDAYEDIAWDSPEMELRPDDPRFELSDNDVLGSTDWYKAQPQEARAGMGLNFIVGSMKVGVIFESVLKRGLLEFAHRLPNRSPEFRYAYHEVIEEAQHSLMFQEFVNRSGLDPGGLDAASERGARFVIWFGRVFPALFFFFVLGGEEPIDHAQKQLLRSGRALHPLTRRIMQIHITEEARHLCFARNYLQRNVPRLGWVKRAALKVAVPFILGQMARMMLEPSPGMIKRFAIPGHVVRAAYTNNPVHADRVRASLATVAKLCIELGLLTRREVFIWRSLGLGNPLEYAA
jgi:hypothetical protein